MLKKVSIMLLLASGFFMTFSCMSQGDKKKDDTPEVSVEQNLPKLLTPSQLILLDSVSKITLFNMVDSPYEGIKQSERNKELSNKEVALFLSSLKNASKDTTLNIHPGLEDAYKIVVEGDTDFLTLVVDSSFKQITVGDVRSGVTTSNVNKEFLNTLKSIVENE